MFRGALELCSITLVMCGCTQTLDFDAVSQQKALGEDGELVSRDLWVASASHTLDMSDPAFAIDGTVSTNWISGATQSPGMWLAVDLGETVAVRTIQLDARSDRQDTAEKLDVYTSDDNEHWKRVRAGVPGDPEQSIDFAEPISTRGLKLSLAADVTKDRWWRVDELRVLK